MLAMNNGLFSRSAPSFRSNHGTKDEREGGEREIESGELIQRTEETRPACTRAFFKSADQIRNSERP